VSHHVPLFAHAQSGAVGATTLALIGAVAASASIWLVRLNLNVDAEEDPMTQTEGSRSTKSATLGLLAICGLVVLLMIGGFLVFRTQSDLSSSQAQTVVDDLCRAADQAATDTTAALATFNTSPHNALHGLDTDLRRSDPIAAQRLAAAKAAAENALIEGLPNAAELTTALADQTAAAYRILEPDTTVNSCA
jgi:hypothetical protein